LQILQRRRGAEAFMPVSRGLSIAVLELPARAGSTAFV
jgi:hypothetical protein